MSVRRSSTILLFAICLQTGVGGNAEADWAPQRPVYDYNRNEPGGENCLDPASRGAEHGRCGPLDGPVFNSFVNTPSYGDERPFFDGRLAERPGTENGEPIYVQDGASEAILRIYVDNNANENIGYRTIASQATVRVDLPAETASRQEAQAFISAANAVPHTVSDTVWLIGERPFELHYVLGSAKLLRGGGTYRLNDGIVGGGAFIGDQTMNGSFSAGFDNAALIELRVAIVGASEPGNSTLLIVALLAGAALLIVALHRPTRERLAGLYRWWWQMLRDADVQKQVVATLIAAAIVGLVGVGLKLLLA